MKIDTRIKEFLLEEASYKHLPGGHRQSDHGNRRGAGLERGMNVYNAIVRGPGLNTVDSRGMTRAGDEVHQLTNVKVGKLSTEPWVGNLLSKLGYPTFSLERRTSMGGENSIRLTLFGSKGKGAKTGWIDLSGTNEDRITNLLDELGYPNVVLYKVM